jgi:glycosyltransferase involved in cell wall biosynthesis
MDIFLKKKYIKDGVAERIPGSGVDYNFYSPQEKKDNYQKFSFLFISRLVKDKGIIEFVNAARILRNEIDAEYKILGPLWLQNLKQNTVSKDELQQWIDEGIVKYLGEAKDVKNYIAEADCIVLPSYREGTSNVLLEASSMQKPCITTDTAGCRDVVTDGVTGFLCRVRDEKDLADKMKKMFLLTEEERIEMGKKGREKMIAEYDKQIVINAYLAAIKKLTGNAI